MIGFSEIEQAHRILLPVVHKTPLLSSRTFNQLTGNEVYFKAENLQRIGAFKIRGAYNKLASLSEGERSKGVIAHSSGNHAQGVALAGRMLGTRAVVVMPENSIPSKVEAARSYGADIVFCGNTTDDRQRMTAGLIDRHGYVLIHPYDDPFIIAGQGTVGYEIFRELRDLDYLFVCVGGGGLIAGTALAAKSMCPGVRVIGVETAGANDAYQSFRQKRIVKLETVRTIADGMRTQSMGTLNFELIMTYVDDMVTVEDEDLFPMMRFFFERMKTVVEPTGAVAAAAVMTNVLGLKGKKIGVTISGGNVDAEMFGKVLTMQ